jgi:hypothetical protein
MSRSLVALLEIRLACGQAYPLIFSTFNCELTLPPAGGLLAGLLEPAVLMKKA